MMRGGRDIAFFFFRPEAVAREGAWRVLEGLVLKVFVIFLCVDLEGLHGDES